jgi:glycosyltransferase involved in cell wall biosynthesis
MKIFYVLPYAPNPIRVRPYNLIRNLAKRGHQVSVYTLYTDEIEKNEINSLRNTCQVEAQRITNRASIMNSLKALPTREPLQAVYSWHPGLAEKLLTDIVIQKPDIIHVEHLRGARYGLFIKSSAQQLSVKVPIVWDSVDCISDLFTQAVKRNTSLRQKIILWLEIPRTRNFESSAVRLFDKVLVTSPKDAQALHEVSGNGLADGSIHVLPNGVDLDTFQPCMGTAREKNTLIVSGKMSYHANIAMTQFLVQEIMPKVWQKIPEVKLWVVGKDPPREIQNLVNHPQIRVTGMVEDIAEYLRRATIAVAPLRYGAGIQNKILEAMACETPVITNHQATGSLSAREGIDLMVANDADEFATLIHHLLEDDTRRVEIGLSGRRYVETFHNWTDITAQLEAIYKQLITR